MPLHPDRCFDPDPAQRQIARQLYQAVAGLPLICPHGHVDPSLFTTPSASLGTPASLIVIPDHYIFRMLYSQGISLESLGIPTQDGTPTEADPRRIWQLFGDHFYLFRGTPTGMWLTYELETVFGVSEKLDSRSALRIYDQIAAQMAAPDFAPRALFERFNIEVLCTTDAATDTLESHQAIRASDWRGRILPTFRPDAVVNIDFPGWRANIDRLSEVSGITIHNYLSFVRALEQRRVFFKAMGASATDHAALTPYTGRLGHAETEAIFNRALHGEASTDDAILFTGHMLIEMARMSSEDGLVMQLHVGSLRNHNPQLGARFGRDMGADIPIQTEFTRNLKPLLDEFGANPHLTLILFTLDETTYARELAPLAGHYPILRLGPPWWFHDSFNGMNRYFDQVMETAGLYNTVGFNDDTRAFPSIPARHDLWRRAACNWLARGVVMGLWEDSDAAEMATDCAYNLAKRAYRL